MILTLPNGQDVWVGIVSHLRPENVKPMSKLVGAATWYVGHGESYDYRPTSTVPHGVVESGGLCRSRNAILDDAFALGVPAVELSDDMRKLEFAKTKNRADLQPMTFPEAVAFLLKTMEEFGSWLGGVAPTANPFYLNPKKPVKQHHFVVGDFIVVRPTELRFDEGMRLKEDYDYTLQHIRRYGGIARCDNIMATFLHRGNAGGACAVRTSELEQESISHLKRKWPGFIHDNPKRRDEVVLKMPR